MFLASHRTELSHSPNSPLDKICPSHRTVYTPMTAHCLAAWYCSRTLDPLGPNLNVKPPYRHTVTYFGLSPLMLPQWTSLGPLILQVNNRFSRYLTRSHCSHLFWCQNTVLYTLPFAYLLVLWHRASALQSTHLYQRLAHPWPSLILTPPPTDCILFLLSSSSDSK